MGTLVDDAPDPQGRGLNGDRIQTIAGEYGVEPSNGVVRSVDAEFDIADSNDVPIETKSASFGW